MKIWDTKKLESVLDRCNAPPAADLPTATASSLGGKTSLSRLLENERLHGTTERDPTQRRHDFHYFSKNAFFVLVEDLHEELATIHAMEYPIRRTRDGREEGDWPVLYCDPDTRGPFNKPDDRERRRARRQVDCELETQRREIKAFTDRIQKRAAEAERLQQAKQAGDLRRSVSMTNLRRRALSNASEHLPDMDNTNHNFDLDADLFDSANASGYLHSHYTAASGNSVMVTSTTGMAATATTSVSNNSVRSGSGGLPASLRGKQKHEILTSLKANASRGKGDMGPPPGIPQQQGQSGAVATLRKSKSTTTMRLPKRDEGAKPGYCENCRQKYNDFEEVRSLSPPSFYLMLTLRCDLAYCWKKASEVRH
jgi:regulatory subunit for Cdc7p protein kinase